MSAIKNEREFHAGWNNAQHGFKKYGEATYTFWEEDEDECN